MKNHVCCNKHIHPWTGFCPIPVGLCSKIAVFSLFHRSRYIMSTRDAIQSRSDTDVTSGATNTASQFFDRQPKRARTDGNATNPGTSTMAQTPIVQLNDQPLNSVSTETVVHNPRYRETEREKEHLTFKLDKLNDKKCRFESHEAFLNKCLTNNLIPNGLKVYVEPSIGNRDDEFLSQWHARLDEFSRTLTSDVAEYCVKEIAKTKEEIETISNKLKDLIPAPEFSNISKAITTNETTRVNELTQRKNRKFYKLKYKHNNNEGRSMIGQERGAFNNWHDDRRDGQQQHRWEMNDRSNTRNRYQRDQYGDNGNYRNEGSNRNRNERDHYDDNGNYRNEVNERNRYNQNNNANQRNFGRRPGVTYANATSTDRSNDNSRRPSYRNLQTAQTTDIPLHERVSLHRRNSKRNLTTERNDTQPGSRNEEIEELRRRLNQLENGQTEKVLSHQVIQPESVNRNTKNANPAQRTETGQNKSEIAEMRNFLVGVIQTISEFDKRLTSQLNTDPTRSERS